MLVSIVRLIFVFGGVILGVVGSQFLVSRLLSPESPNLTLFVIVGLALVGAGSGYVIGGAAGRHLSKIATWLEAFLQQARAIDLILGTVGLVLGLIITYLIFPVLREFGGAGLILSILFIFIFGSLGWEIFWGKRKELEAVISSFAEREGQGLFWPEKILDTSAIIDGRIADLIKTDFIEGRLNIPRFVLRELQEIADLEDPLKRSRGRRGLEILAELQKNPRVPLRILEKDFPETREVDEKLVKLAKEIKGSLITQDYNLLKVAEVQKVKVLNLNELVNALKPAVLSGEELKVKLIKEGKEKDQGVGYLDDGTMVVVEEGKKYLGNEVEAVVKSVLQTPSGKIIFAKLKSQIVKSLNKNHL